MTGSIALFAFGPLSRRFVEALRKEVGSANFYDFLFYGRTLVHHVGWIVAGVSLDLWSRGSFLFDNLPFLLAWVS
jgi:biotin transporter BioY